MQLAAGENLVEKTGGLLVIVIDLYNYMCTVYMCLVIYNNN